jgi:hypothetical protein
MPRSITPDGRYFVVRGRLWRMANPELTEVERRKLESKLGRARALVRVAHLQGDVSKVREQRAEIDRVKRALGERRPVWWDDGAPDYNKLRVVNTPYAGWWAARSKEKNETWSAENGHNNEARSK